MPRYRVLLVSVLVALFMAPVVLPPGLAREQTASEAGQAGALAQPAAQPAVQPAITVPPPEVLLVLVRTTLIALNQANITGNYTTLRDLGAPGLQANTTAATLAIAFTKLRNQNTDLSPVAVINPQLTEPPSITPQGLLKLSGFFPTQPLQITFQLQFQPVNGRWRLFGMSVDTATAAAAPAPVASTQPTEPSAAPVSAATAPAAKSKKKKGTPAPVADSTPAQ